MDDNLTQFSNKRWNGYILMIQLVIAKYYSQI